MLVFMSDLHFVDSSAGDHNVRTGAFELVFRRIANLAEKAKAESIEVILLGDTVDLLRTEYWFGADVKKNELPWSIGVVDKERLTHHSETILKRIAAANEKTFSLFKNIKDFIKTEQQEGITEDVRLTYIPGNHDRLLSLDDTRLMQPLLGEMGATLNRHGSRFKYENAEYSVSARHGHEFDPWNFESNDDTKFNDNATFEDYLRPPIGDPITTELVTKLPFLAEKGLSNPDEAESIKRRLQEIDDVRPLSSVLKWLFFQFKDDKAHVRDVVESTIDTVTRDFKKIPYVQQWFDKHDKFLRPDRADALQAVLSIADHIQITKAETLFKAVDLGGRLRPEDPLETAAETELLKSAQTERPSSFLIYGHTHTPKQIAVNVCAGEESYREQVYLNTGTFRARHHEAKRRGFITWKQLSYVTLYSPKEAAAMGAASEAPAFETWTGARRI